MRKKRNKVGNIGRFVLSIFILLIVLAGGSFIGFNMYMNSAAAPYDPADTSTIGIVVPSGATTSRIGDILSDNGLIKSAFMFKIIARQAGYDGKLKAGEYSLSRSMPVHDILHIISLGSAAQTKRFTVPEGYSIAKVAAKLENDGFVDKEAFLYAVENGKFLYKFIEELPIGANRLEGFLFPETYDVYMDATEEDIINKMLSQFDKIFTDEYYLRTSRLNLSLLEVITIASLIEAESRIDFERPIIASVIYNRLSVGMQLQLDATVQYALGETKDRLLIKDTEIDHPYNTYRIMGLPPGPICSPGEASIHAALYPEDTDYLFYVLKPDKSGEHNFSKSLSEHNKYAREYWDSLK